MERAPPASYERVVLDVVGRTRWIRARCVPDLNLDGSVRSGYIVGHDITDLKVASPLRDRGPVAPDSGPTPAAALGDPGSCQQTVRICKELLKGGARITVASRMSRVSAPSYFKSYIRGKRSWPASLKGNEMSVNKWIVVACTSGLLITPLPAAAGLDHKITFDESGIWNRDVQKGVEYGSIAVVLGGALWEGGEDRLGRTFWQAVDSTVVASVAAQAGKYIFSRARPTQTDDPNQWFQGSGHQSFPSGEVALVSSAVAPFVFEYGREHPAVWGLELFTVYDMIARVKSQAHWQTDVLAGAALGTAVGYFANQRNQPFFLGLMPNGVQVGYRTKF